MIRTIDRRAVARLLGGLAVGAVVAPGLATAAPLAIDRTAFVPLGGLDQCISIRGEDQLNPVLLVVHGGPGEAQWPVMAHYRAWERRFTVVQWDQRGAGQYLRPLWRNDARDDPRPDHGRRL